jgi:D-ribose pyranose/furanose isomerase RbsD
MEYYSAINNNDFMKFLGKWMELENIILSEVTQSQKNTHGRHSLISGAQKFRIPKIQFTDHMKLKKKEDQTVDASVLLRSGEQNT